MNQEVAQRPVTVAIVEDHPEFRDSLSNVLDAAPQFELISVCRDLPAGQRLLEERCPDVLLVDLGLPTGSGLTLIRMAQARCPGLCTSAVLTVTGHEDHLMTAISAGAKGYLFKSDQPKDWLAAVCSLARGHSPLHPALAHGFLKRLRSPAAESDGGGGGVWMHPDWPIQIQSLLLHIAAGYSIAEAATRLNLTLREAGRYIRDVYNHFVVPVPSLSPRELELLGLLNKGFTFKKCADLMGVSESTSKTQAARAYQKLGASNLQSALYEARMAGLIV